MIVARHADQNVSIDYVGHSWVVPRVTVPEEQGIWQVVKAEFERRRISERTEDLRGTEQTQYRPRELVAFRSVRIISAAVQYR